MAKTTVKYQTTDDPYRKWQINKQTKQDKSIIKITSILTTMLIWKQTGLLQVQTQTHTWPQVLEYNINTQRIH